MADTQSPHTGEQDDPCEGGRHCCCCGPYEPCCDCGQLMPSKACIGERCWCGAPAAKKIGEEILFDDPMPDRHNLTAYVCAAHYAQVMGPSGAQQVHFTTAARQPEAMADQSTEARLREALELARHVRRMVRAENDHARGIAEAQRTGEQERTSRDEVDMIHADLYTAFPAKRLDAMIAALSLPVQDTSDELTRLRAEVGAWKETGAAIDEAWKRYKASSPCTLPPEGWYCSRASGHDGPCAARSLSARTTLNGEQANG